MSTAASFRDGERSDLRRTCQGTERGGQGVARPTFTTNIMTYTSIAKASNMNEVTKPNGGVPAHLRGYAKSRIGNIDSSDRSFPESS